MCLASVGRINRVLCWYFYRRPKSNRGSLTRAKHKQSSKKARAMRLKCCAMEFWDVILSGGTTLQVECACWRLRNGRRLARCQSGRHAKLWISDGDLTPQDWDMRQQVPLLPMYTAQTAQSPELNLSLRSDKHGVRSFFSLFLLFIPLSLAPIPRRQPFLFFLLLFFFILTAMS